ncbi:hypothetical protein, partial [Bradyrhizobium vignae]
PSVAFAAESERLGGTCASLLENVRINRCSRYLNAYGEGRVPAGHPRSTVRKLRYEKLHSGIQVKPNIGPSLRSGFTALACFARRAPQPMV